jgi:xylan 1,4-beta-xylosidase
MQVDRAALQFHWRVDGDWQPVGPILDASLISDEAGRGEHGSFTGAFVGIAAFDISGSGRPADFGRFSYAAEARGNG